MIPLDYVLSFLSKKWKLGSRQRGKNVGVFHVVRLMLMEQDATHKHGYRVLLSVASSSVFSSIF